MDYEELLRMSPYGASQKEKEVWYLKFMEELVRHHRKNCPSYDRILSVLGDSDCHESLEQIPMLPVSLFKKQELSSIKEADVFKIMTSSGTAGQQVSKIVLDRKTAEFQQKTLSVIMQEFLGPKRIPMMILDSPNVLKDRRMFSARGAGILGFSIFASERIFAFDENMELSFQKLEAFFQRHEGERIFLFGFTYMVWQFFVLKLRQSGRKLSIPEGILIHGGGWKKLSEKAVSKEQFQSGIWDVCGIENVKNYYGMVEQTGCIYVECEHGHLHTSIFSELMTRRSKDFSVCEIGEQGIIQVMSPMAWSYPGHSLLTDDLGVVLGKDDCPCGRKGTYFKINGRIRQAEIRGCSDTYER